MTAATRHRWAEVGSHRKRCGACDLLAIRRPNPYGRQWWTEWTRGEQSWNTLQGDKTPPCQPEQHPDREDNQP
ncbi:hypothetical protein [Streptomyces sp. NRRL S-350]|uniref:hypothetical protein n=1 Tax=Streptomyces sp. NRRL S-350 TaxID=1463902 RepID=UPI000AD2E934|nr:hypothetical protein [Streptomyces sp. NRRL S-350]